MKKKVLFVFIGLLVLLSACSGNSASDKKNGKVKIGIVQFIEHEALDNARIGFEEKIKELGIDVEIDYKNAQGEIATARTIAEKFVNDKVDLIFAIATPAAEAAAAVTEEIPILFSAVTDAEKAQLVEKNEKPGGNVTGTSDAVDVENQLSMLKDLSKDIKKVGVLYSADEQNSLVQVEEVKKASSKLGLDLKAVSIQNISDLPQTAESLIKDVDAIYILSDNKIASSISLLTDVANRNKIPTVCVEEAHVRGGGLISKGISYKELGSQTAEMAKRILVDGVKTVEISVETSKNLDKIVNKKTIEVLGLDKGMDLFKDAKDIDEKGK